MSSATGPAPHLEEKPTILIIQDCFQTPAIYKDLVDRLVSLGYPTVHPLLPTCGDAQHANFPSLTLLDDATAVQSELVRLVEHEQKTVMVVMHGYGGMVGSEAVLEDMSYSKRRGKGLSGGVIHLFFVCASLVGPGQSMLGGLDSSSNHKVESDGRYTITNGSIILYNDLPRSEALLWESRLIPHSSLAQQTALTRAAYNYIPSTYLICASDLAYVAWKQELAAKKAKSQVERCTAGHSPMLSQLDMLVKRIERALEKAVAVEEGLKDGS